MLDRSRKFKVGLFVVGSGFVLCALLLLAIGTSFTKSSVRYTIQFEETVKGMVIGSSVNFQGVQIGSVADMRFVGGRTEVVVEVDPERAPITEHCRASLDRAWVTGQVTVELSGWQQGAAVLPAGALIRARLSPMSSLAKSLPAMLDDLSGTLTEYRMVGENLNNLLGGDNAEEIAQLLRTTRSLFQRIDGSAGPLLDGVRDQTLPRLNSLLAKLGDLEPELRSLMRVAGRVGTNLESLSGDPALRSTLAAGPELMAALKSASKSLGRGSDELRHLLRGQGPGLDRALATLDGALREVGALARVLRSTPSALIFGEAKRERAGVVPASSGRED